MYDYEINNLTFYNLLNKDENLNNEKKFKSYKIYEPKGFVPDISIIWDPVCKNEQ